MQESTPKTSEDESKFWLTTDADPSVLQEFFNKDAFRHKRVTKNHQLPFKLDGNSHVVHDGHFYYNQFGTNKLIKYELATNHTYFRHIEEASHRPYTSKLYETQYNYMDLMADENGLWVVFARNNTNNTLVLKFDPVTLDTENVWNITLDHTMIGEMFIACGILYGTEPATETFTKIRFAFDLYLNSPVDISVNFTNPFKHNNLIAYNPRHEKIYAWDSKNLIEYPLKFTESTSESEEESEEQATRTTVHGAVAGEENKAKSMEWTGLSRGVLHLLVAQELILLTSSASREETQGGKKWDRKHKKNGPQRHHYTYKKYRLPV